MAYYNELTRRFYGPGRKTLYSYGRQIYNNLRRRHRDENGQHMREKMRAARQMKRAQLKVENGATTVEQMAEEAIQRWARTVLKEERQAAANAEFRRRKEQEAAQAEGENAGEGAAWQP